MCGKANKKSVFSLVKMAENLKNVQSSETKIYQFCIYVIFLDLQGHQLQQDNDSQLFSR